MASGKYTKCNFGSSVKEKTKACKCRNNEWVIKTDGSGHYYLVPLSLEKKFVEMLATIEESGGEDMKMISKFDTLFDEHRIEGYHEIIITNYRKR